MCDYSLLNVPNRLAVEGEELVVHRFLASSLGLTSPSALQIIAETQAARRGSGFWAALKSWFVLEPVETPPAVCIPPGARLLLQDIPWRLRNEFGVAEREEVTFTQLSARPNTYRDAIRFGNGREVLLQRLKPGQRVKVLSLEPPDEVIEQETTRLSPARLG